MTKIKSLLLAVIGLLCSVSVSAYDFVADGIYYNIISNQELRAFYDCKNLTRVTIPDNVTKVGDFAFSGCENITNLEIGSGVSNLGTNTFRGCNRITDLSINCSIIDKWFAGKPLKKLLIGDSVTRIEDEAFYQCKDLADVVIGNSVTRIGNQTFYDCSSLTNVDIPNSITEIGKNAFTYCSALTSISIPESVTNIGDGAFSNCRSLQRVILPNNWVKIGPNLFAYCYSLTSLTIPNSVTSIGAEAFVCCEALTNLTIPNSVRSIGKSAFSGCSGLTNIVIPSKVTKIEEATFMGCSGLTNLDIPKNVKIIDVHAFEFCTGLTNITIPNNVTSIGGCAFYGCANLNTITIGQNVTSFGDYVFAGTAWYDNQPDGVVYLDKYLLDYKGTMPEQTSLNIKDGTVLIANLALGYTPNLISVTIPNSVTHIGKWAFNNCKDMKYLYISSEIESIEENAFYGCENLIDIQMASRKAIAVSEDIFSNSTYRKACLYVPNGCKADYEATTPWNKFNITEMDFTGVNDVFKDNTTSKVYYDLNGRMVTNPINGIYILNGKKVWVK